MLKKAIDIVLIPSNEIIDLAIDLNSGLKHRDICLNRIHAIPHVSIAMAVIDSSSEALVVSQFDNLSKRFTGIELELSQQYCHYYESGSISGIGIKKSPELLILHREACELLSKY